MTLEQLIAFNLALFAALISPGPAFLLTVQTAVQSGRRAGAAVGCGLAVVAATWTLMALLGLEAIFRIVPWAYTAVKIAGALYLIYLAWGMWRGATRPLNAQVDPARQRLGRAFRRGLLINLLNPKSVLFAAAVLVVVFPGGTSLLDKVIIVANHVAIEVLFYGAMAFGFGSAAVSRRYLRMKMWLDRIAAAVLTALGIRLLLSR